jgi:uncharacterized RDD family membrane protein YckC
MQSVPVAGAPEVTPQPQSPGAQAYGVSHALPALTLRYAGFWMRFVAFVIDAVLVGIVVWPVSLIMRAVIGFSGSAIAMPTMGIHLVGGLVSLAFSSLVNWLYEALLESSSKQATVGKMVLALKVTDLGGRRISFARATGRHFAKIISGMILLIGYIMAGFTAKKQGLHDMIAGTLVVRTQ